MNPLRETFLVFAHELRRSLRSAKTLVLLILYALATGIFGLVMVAATRKIQEQIAANLQGQEVPPEALMQMKMGGLSMIFGKDDEQLRYLASMPLIVILFAWFALFFLPLLATLIGFDQISGELQTRSIRFVSLRARRGSLLAGKVLAQLALLVGLTAVINLGVFAYAAISVEGFPIGAGLLALVRFWALTLVYATTYVGLATWCSSLFRVPIFSLLTALAALLLSGALHLLSMFERLGFLKYALPSHYQEGFFKPDPLSVLASIGVFAAFSAILLGLSYLTLRARDL
ncbi:MAG: ABC transporter permease subunit [Deltaproteobacteria bacterium]|nr:ABC transporter permease subunit [Deltaproteobacteria bacterium]